MSLQHRACIKDVDADGDMLSGYLESLHGTDSERPDTDGDGRPDG